MFGNLKNRIPQMSRMATNSRLKFCSLNVPQQKTFKNNFTNFLKWTYIGQGVVVFGMEINYSAISWVCWNVKRNKYNSFSGCLVDMTSHIIDSIPIACFFATFYPLICLMQGTIWYLQYLENHRMKKE